MLRGRNRAKSYLRAFRAIHEIRSGILAESWRESFLSTKGRIIITACYFAVTSGSIFLGKRRAENVSLCFSKGNGRDGAEANKIASTGEKINRTFHSSLARSVYPRGKDASASKIYWLI